MREAVKHCKGLIYIITALTGVNRLIGLLVFVWDDVTIRQMPVMCSCHLVSIKTSARGIPTHLTLKQRQWLTYNLGPRPPRSVQPSVHCIVASRRVTLWCRPLCSISQWDSSTGASWPIVDYTLRAYKNSQMDIFRTSGGQNLYLLLGTKKNKNRCH